MSKFGYLNQNNPIFIGQNEAQEMVNCRIDKGILEFGSFPIDSANPTPGRYLVLPNQREVKIDESFYNSGYVRWRKQGSSDAWSRIGIQKPGVNPAVVVPNVIVDTVGLVAFKPEVGRHFYAITLYDPDTYEESPAVLDEVEYTEADSTADKRILFAGFADLSTVYPSRPNLEWRFYRMPFGGEEYLLSMTWAACTTFSAEFKLPDAITNENLGSMCNTLELVDAPLEALSMSIELYADKLWIAAAVAPAVPGGKHTGILYYSRTGVWNGFEAAGFFAFPDRIVGITPCNETLVVQTEGKSYVIYGDDKSNFIRKPIDYEFPGLAHNSGRAINGLGYFLAARKDPNDPTINQALGILAFNSRNVTDVSAKISKELPKYLFIGSRAAKNAVMDNRFYIVEVTEKTGSTWHSPTKIVYDTFEKGFCLGRDYLTTFTYRTKEFKAESKAVQFYKRLFVRGKGEFTVELLGDGQLITLLNYNLANLDTVHFNVKPNRYTTFSIRFSGKQGTEIHDWGIDD